MRTEICVALIASAAVHAGLLALPPVAFAPRHPAAAVPAAPRIFTASLKNTLESEAAAQPATLESARVTKTRGARRLAVGRPARSARASRRLARVENPLRFYPPEAIAQGLEGETILMLRFGADDALIDARVAKSSGHAILDAAALRAIRATPRIARGAGEMLFPVTFSLH